MQLINVTEQNRDMFERMVPEEFFDPLDMPGHFVLGAVGEDEEGPYIAGVLSFCIKSGNIDGENVFAALLQWLYVGSEFRGRGAGDALMEEFFRLVSASGVETAICDAPFDIGSNDLIVFLERWGFEFLLTEVQEVRVSLERLSKISQFDGKVSPSVHALEDVSEDVVVEAYVNALECPNIVSDLSEVIQNCDPEVSCIKSDKNKVFGMALVVPKASDILEIAFLRDFSKNPQDLMDLIYFISHQIKERYSKDTQIRFTIRNDTAFQIADNLLPDIEPVLVYRGICPTSEEEV